VSIGLRGFLYVSHMSACEVLTWQPSGIPCPVIPLSPSIFQPLNHDLLLVWTSDNYIGTFFQHGLGSLMVWKMYGGLIYKLEDNQLNNNNNNFIQDSMFSHTTGHVPELSDGVV
jgi:hypothetical protein